MEFHGVPAEAVFEELLGEKYSQSNIYPSSKSRFNTY